jgi:hypothetical protein
VFLYLNNLKIKVMKTFRFTTTVQSIKTIQYVIEAETEEEAAYKLWTGSERGEGEEIDEDINWGTEQSTDIEFIEEL